MRPPIRALSPPASRLRPSRLLAAFAVNLLLAAASASHSAAQPTPVTTLPPLVVSATRAPQNPATLPLTVEVFTAADLSRAPTLALDDTLRRSAAFSLFRRSGSLTANPTAQGVSLRGIGPSGASRALVLLDGLPVNDPFGGWVAWTKLPAAALDRVEIVRGGGSSAWGGSSLGGVVHLVSAPLLPTPAPDPHVNQWLTSPAAPSSGAPPSPHGSLAATLGDFRTRGAEAAVTVPAPSGRDAFRVDAAHLATNGVRLVRDPGVIDRPADLAASRARLAWTRRIDATTTLTTTARAWQEDRGNGTPVQRNASRELFLSSTLSGTPAGSAVSAWSITLHAQDQDYRSAFSAVNAARDAETPASDQYAVPARAAGLAAQLTFGDASASDALTTLGLDARHVDGETREHFAFDIPSSTFLRERRAGGAQTVAGLFATHARPIRPDLTLTLGARLDSTSRRDGFLRETLRATGATTTELRHPDRDDLAFSPSAGLAWRATDTLTARAAAYSAYRTPTLNELYRPFRVGLFDTLANPALDPETLLGGELGLEWTAPDRRRGLRATVFENALSDAVANVTIAPNIRQRRNLDSTGVRGLELGAHCIPALLPSLRLDADYLLSDARVRSGGPGANALDGKRLAQVPRHTLSAGASWQATRDLDLDLRAHWFSAQYEDDLNNLELASATRLDFAARHALTPRLRLGLAVENLLDAETETSRTGAGVVGVAPPRWVRAELSYMW